MVGAVFLTQLLLISLVDPLFFLMKTVTLLAPLIAVLIFESSTKTVLTKMCGMSCVVMFTTLLSLLLFVRIRSYSFQLL